MASLRAEPFLDLADRVSCCGERGLLSVAFPPDYAARGHFYVNYTNRGGDTVIARFRLTADPDVADPTSEEVVLTVPQPYANHNGGPARLWDQRRLSLHRDGRRRFRG